MRAPYNETFSRTTGAGTGAPYTPLPPFFGRLVISSQIIQVAGYGASLLGYITTDADGLSTGVRLPDPKGFKYDLSVADLIDLSAHGFPPASVYQLERVYPLDGAPYQRYWVGYY